MSNQFKMEYEIIVIGTSMGGLAALETIFTGLPADFAVPIAVVQHRSSESLDTMLKVLRRYTSLRLREPSDKEPIEPGTIYVAPPDYHLMVEPGYFALSTGPVVSYARPSIDVLFDSAADAYKSRVIGIVLTGANSDGAAGARRIKAVGGVVLAQDPTTAECAVMPKATIKDVKVDRILTLEEISPCLASLCGNKESSSNAA
jgi:two-component system chemotaxis response regulator CheB